jgi:hypothetical protein
MSKNLPDWAFNQPSCSKCNCPSCQPSCDPIDININVNCCCPTDDGGDDGCCCGEGIHEALQFIENQIPDANIAEIDIFGINSTALINDARIINLFPYGNDIMDVVQVQQGAQGKIYDLSTCYIYNMDVSLQNLEEGQLDAIKALLQENFTTDNSPTCCCRTGLIRALSFYMNNGTRIELGMNNTDSDLNDIEGAIVAISNDVVWMDTGTPQQPQLSVASLCYAISITPA